MNCVLMPLIWPVFMLGIALISIISSLGMAKTTGLWTRLVADGTIFRLLKGELPVAVAVLTAAGIAVMMSMFCVISATAMSRKGSEYIYMKCIPMSYHDQIRAMLVSGILISLLGTLPYALVFNIIAVSSVCTRRPFFTPRRSRFYLPCSSTMNSSFLTLHFRN